MGDTFSSCGSTAVKHLDGLAVVASIKQSLYEVRFYLLGCVTLRGIASITLVSWGGTCHTVYGKSLN